MKATHAEVNLFTGSCFRMVRIVSKNNFFEIKISQRYYWVPPSSIMVSCLIASTHMISYQFICCYRIQRTVLANLEKLRNLF